MMDGMYRDGESAFFVGTIHIGGFVITALIPCLQAVLLLIAYMYHGRLRRFP